MARTRGARSVAILALALIAATPVPRFGIGDVKFAPAADDVVGSRRSGLLCTPAGKLRWRDLKPDEAMLKRAIAQAIASAGVDVKVPSDDDFDTEMRTLYRINISVIHVAAKTCVPWRGIRIGDQARLKIDGRLVTIWRVFDRQTRALISKTRICRDFRAETPSVAPVQVTLVGMTDDLLPALSTVTAVNAGERSVGCDLREQGLPGDV